MDYPKVPQEINNIVEDNVKLLAQIFPSAVKDGQVDLIRKLGLPLKAG